MRTFSTYDSKTITEEEKRPYVYKNLALLMAGDWFLEKEIAKTITDSIPAIDRFEKREGFEDPEETELSELIKEPVKEVYPCQCFQKNFAQCWLMKLIIWKS